MKIMNNKKVLVNGLFESTNDLRSVFVGHIHFRKLMKFRNFIIISIDENHFKEGKYGTT